MNIAGDDDLLVFSNQLIVLIEVDLLCSRLLHSLDIIDQQEVAFHEA